MAKITMTIEAPDMEQARAIHRRIEREMQKYPGTEHEALLVAEGKSKKIKSRPQAASSSDQSSTSTPSTSS